ncbi:guanylate cyclase alpha-like isoform X2 [Hylaeus volcanicus]|uniref:guanylate cyclase alpha-like isoform X2 n=1 Tax=Hylaeus volcanicus TaxID=313075 RepID=UPI0023B7B0C6|nr:guanylate cyclase alpha-like isoform X2 [Hylaeus volcanicus]
MHSKFRRSIMKRDHFQQSFKNSMKTIHNNMGFLKKNPELYNKTRQFSLWDSRKVVINASINDDVMTFPDNTVRFHRYSWYTFLPCSVFNRFTSFPNCWFFLVVIVYFLLSGFSFVSTLSFFFFAVHFFFEVLEDGFHELQKYYYSKSWNNRLVHLIMNTETCTTKRLQSYRLCVGNIIFLHDGEEVPADIILLSTSDIESIAYVDTSFVDGKTDLTIKSAVKETRGAVTLHAVGAIRGRIMCEEPTVNLDEFAGNLRLEAHPRSTQLTMKNFILRGSIIKNTESVYGVIVYTGHDTRIILNNSLGNRSSKQSNPILNSYVSFFILLILCTLSVSFIISAEIRKYGLLSTVIHSAVVKSSFWRKLLQFFHIYTKLLPMTVILSIDCLKLIRFVSLKKGVSLLKKKDDNRVATSSTCLNGNVSLMLSMVDFLFTDKTETLTERALSLQMCLIKGRVYGGLIKENGSQQQYGLSRHGDMEEKERNIRQGFGHSDNSISKKKWLQCSMRKQTYTGNRSLSLELRSVSSFSRDDSFYTNDSLPMHVGGSLDTVSDKKTYEKKFLTSLYLSEHKESDSKYLTHASSSQDEKLSDTQVSLQSITVPKKCDYLESMVVSLSHKTNEAESQINVEEKLERQVSSLSVLPCVDLKTLFPCWVPRKPFTEEHLLKKTTLHGNSICSSTSLSTREHETKLLKDLRDSHRRCVKDSLGISSTDRCNIGLEFALMTQIPGRVETKNCTFKSDQLLSDLQKSTGRSRIIDHFLKVMALCNTAIPYTKFTKNINSDHNAKKSLSESLKSSHKSSDLATDLNQSLRSMSNTKKFATAKEYLTKLSFPYHNSLAAFKKYAKKKTILKGTTKAKKKINMFKPHVCANNLTKAISASQQQVPVARPHHWSFPFSSNQHAYISKNSLGAQYRRRVTKSTTSFFEKNKTFISQKYRSHGQEKTGATFSNYRSLQEKKKLSPLAHCRQTADSGLHPWIASAIDSSNVLTGLAYKASSCDDECLVYAASSLGYTFMLRTKSSLYLQIDKVMHRYELLDMNYWDPERRRISVLLKKKDSHLAVLYCKGAPESMIPLLRLSNIERKKLMEELQEFSFKGLRCLVFAYRRVSLDEAALFCRYPRSSSKWANVSRKEKMFCAHRFERNLQYLGMTGAREKLKADVPQTIEMFNEAGLRIWMVTGDNLYNSIHVGYSSKIIPDNSLIFNGDVVMKPSLKGIYHVTLKKISKIFEEFRYMRLSTKRHQAIAFVISGSSISLYLQYTEFLSFFLLMTCSSDAVICARVTPQQKAQLVNLIKTKLKPSPVVLSLGDSSGDVSMLQAADCGVAISARESFPNVAGCDFVVRSFRDLKILMFVDGRHNLVYTVNLMLCFLIMNAHFHLPIFFFKFFSGFTNTKIYNKHLYLFYNFFLSFVITCTASFLYNDIPDSLCENVPLLYAWARRHFYFNTWVFVFWLCEASVICCVTFTIILNGMLHTPFTYMNGSGIDLNIFGFAILYTMALLTNFHCFFSFQQISSSSIVFFIITATIITVFPFLLNIFGFSDDILHDFVLPCFSSNAFWLSVLLVVLCTSALSCIFHYLYNSFFKNIVEDVFKAKKEYEKCTSRTFNGEHGKTTTYAYLRERFNPLVHKKLLDSLPAASHFKLKDIMCTHILSIEDSCKANFRKKKQSASENKMHFSSSEASSTKYDKSAFSSDDSASKEVESEDKYVTSHTSDSFMLLEQGTKDENTRLYQDTQYVKISSLVERFSLTFKNPQLETEFRAIRHKEYTSNAVWYRCVLLFLVVVFFLQITTEIYTLALLRHDHTFYGVIFVEVSLFLYLLLSFWKWFYAIIEYLLIFFFILLTIGFHLSGSDSSVSLTFPCIFGILAFVLFQLPFLTAFLLNFFFLLVFLVDSYVYNSNRQILFLLLPYIIGVTVFTAFTGHTLEYNQRKQFLLNYQVEACRRKQREILNTMLPSFVVKKMLRSPLSKEGLPLELQAQSWTTITIIFCDVYDFQTIVRLLEPTRLVELLDSLFLCFDKCGEQFHCTKIETVFETYLSASGLTSTVPTTSSYDSVKIFQQDAFNALCMSLAMLEVASYITYQVDLCNAHCAGLLHATTRDMDSKNILRQSTVLTSSSIIKNQRYKSGLNKNVYTRLAEQENNWKTNLVDRYETRRIRVKLGMHSGRVISGVVGAKKPQYALFGDTINTASRMKLTGQPDLIHISSATYDLIKELSTFEWTPQRIDIKGKGIMTTYLLAKVHQASYPDFSSKHDLSLQTEWNYISRPDFFLSQSPDNQAKNDSSSLLKESRSLEEASQEKNNLHGKKENHTNNVKHISDKKLFQPDQLFQRALDTKGSNSDFTLCSYSSTQNITGIIPVDTFSVSNKAEQNQKKLSVHSLKNAFLCSLKSVGLSRENKKRNQTYRTCYKNGAVNLERKHNVLPSSSLIQTRMKNSSNKNLNEAWSPLQNFHHGHSNNTLRRRFLHYIPSLLRGSTRVLFKDILKKKKKILQVSLSNARMSDDEEEENNHISFFILAKRLKLYFFTLSFHTHEQEKKYQNYFYTKKSNFKTIEQSLIIFLIIFVTCTMLQLLFNGSQRSETTKQRFQLSNIDQFWTVKAVYTVVWFIMWILLHYRSQQESNHHESLRWITLVLNGIFMSAVFVFMISGAWAFVFENDYLEWLDTDSLQLVFFVTFMHHNTGVLFRHVILLDALLLLMVIIYVLIVCVPTTQTMFIIFLICPILFFNALSAHLKERIDRTTWFVSEERQTTEDRARELLRDMLPKQVLEEFQQDKLKLAYRHDQITFLFADICGFTAYANSVDAIDVLQMLQHLFASFDRDSTRFGLFKLCTIGDAYIAVSEPRMEENSDSNPIEGAERILEMASSMIIKIGEVRRSLKIPSLNMRIGLHYGSCVGGVIGSGRLRYDLWGLDVLTGNLMESNGVPGRINVSNHLKIFLEEQFPGRFRFSWNKSVVVIDRVVNSFLLSNPFDEEDSSSNPHY